MNNILYLSIIVSAAESADGDTPSEIIVTQEVNTVLVWQTSHEEGTQLVNHFSNKNAAIEWAVDKARELRAERSQVDR